VTDDPWQAEEQHPLRFGLVGTGFWARMAHARALASTPGVEFAAVWGRRPEAAAAIADQHGVTAHRDFDAFLADVDAVAFSVPPHVQSELGIRASTAGRHLLLEKPLAIGAAEADALVQAVEQAGVASVVFFTARFQEDVRAWLANVAGTHWTGGQAVWLGSAVTQASPFNTPWRQDKGGLWDLGPHVLSVLSAGLGRVVSLVADRGPGDVAHLVLHHEGGPTSTVTVTLRAPESVDRLELYLWGERGKSSMPALAEDPVAALRTALAELVACAIAGRTEHPCDVRFGREVTNLLVAAQQQIDDRRN